MIEHHLKNRISLSNGQINDDSLRFQIQTKTLILLSHETVKKEFLLIFNDLPKINLKEPRRTSHLQKSINYSVL